MYSINFQDTNKHTKISYISVQSSELSKQEIRKIIPFKISPNRIKYLEINLNK